MQRRSLKRQRYTTLQADTAAKLNFRGLLGSLTRFLKGSVYYFPSPSVSPVSPFFPFSFLFPFFPRITSPLLASSEINFAAENWSKIFASERCTHWLPTVEDARSLFIVSRCIELAINYAARACVFVENSLGRTLTKRAG